MCLTQVACDPAAPEGKQRAKQQSSLANQVVGRKTPDHMNKPLGAF